MPRHSHPKLAWAQTTDEALNQHESSWDGLTHEQASARLNKFGPNTVKDSSHETAWTIFFRQFTSPLVLILVGASFISFALGERTETILIVFLVVVGAALAFGQEYRSELALRALRKKLTRYANVLREGQSIRVSAETLVPGDIVELELGTVIPADLRLLRVQDLEIDESTLTGESFPVAKTHEAIPNRKHLPQEQINIAFMGSHVVQGSGLGLVIRTGAGTEFGKTAAILSLKAEETDFQKGIRTFGNFLVKITVGLVIAVFAILAILRGDWAQSLLFALALAVGISPELLPVIVTITLSRGALAMSKKHVLVKRLIAIEDLGNADVFCTDKTGTLTVGVLRVRGSVDSDGNPSKLPLAFAQRCLALTGRGTAGNPIDEAILESSLVRHAAPELHRAKMRDQISFDFMRRRMSCILERADGTREIITKGATAEILDACTTRLHEHRSIPLTAHDRARIATTIDRYHAEGFRLIGIARRDIQAQETYSPSDEKNLELLGFVLISDAPKRTSKAALDALQQLNVRIVILTGDNEHVTSHVAKNLGFHITGIVTGNEIDRMSNHDLDHAVESANVFARITPEHKLKIIQALKRNKHIVGFMGDGVNDAPALHAADVGISFDSAVDVAKEAASVILLQKKLSVLADGIREGRRTFVNIRTYIYSTISSNFGNMLSVAGAALFLPFIPLLPVQILLLNMISDLPMLMIPSDNVHESELARPHRWNVQRISHFMYLFGTISSLADYATFALLYFVVHADMLLFRSGWFLESMLTELVVIFLLRSRVHSLKNLPSKLLIFASILALGLTFALTQTPLGQPFELVPLSSWMISSIVAIVIGYSIVTEIAKHLYDRKMILSKINHRNAE